MYIYMCGGRKVDILFLGKLRMVVYLLNQSYYMQWGYWCEMECRLLWVVYNIGIWKPFVCKSVKCVDGVFIGGINFLFLYKTYRLPAHTLMYMNGKWLPGTLYEYEKKSEAIFDVGSSRRLKWGKMCVCVCVLCNIRNRRTCIVYAVTYLCNRTWWVGKYVK